MQGSGNNHLFANNVLSDMCYEGAVCECVPESPRLLTPYNVRCHHSDRRGRVVLRAIVVASG